MRDTADKFGRLGGVSVNLDSLKSVSEIGFEPGEGRVLDSKSILETGMEDSIVDSVERIRKIKKSEQRNFTSIRGRKKVIDKVE